ncbi:MAG: DUF3786 domain-containing protein [Actinobacteria bacterium]|nr:DUF3786 domain-containing protein [Actinomycetota bacterium]
MSLQNKEERERRNRAVESALAEIRGLDLDVQAQRGAFACERTQGGGDVLIIPSFGDRIEIAMPEGEMSLPLSMDSLSLRVLALRYVKMSCGVPVSGEWIAYRDLPGGRFYAATLVPTVEQPLARIFGSRKGVFAEASRLLRGEEADYGDEAYVFHPFPRTPLLLILHLGDEEFPPDCRVLFDRCCSSYLNTDDLKVLSTQLAAYLLKIAGEDEEVEKLLWMVE